MLVFNLEMYNSAILLVRKSHFEGKGKVWPSGLWENFFHVSHLVFCSFGGGGLALGQMFFPKKSIPKKEKLFSGRRLEKKASGDSCICLFFLHFFFLTCLGFA
ncbi:hypothetical protein QBC42DRAFT_67518 [Cladorrhinum samala]|uniref:Uncharacterized protein n=1 Tax=Cladorrhinum samala TaxID=585594 RepID=A0AAV9HRD3_9PEZI|nr:hypothetical protein QBC42DRAFT_67518 [Cladorrhinum samala]